MASQIVDGGNAFSVFTDTLDGGNAFTVYPAGGPELTPMPGGAPVPSVQVVVSDVLPTTVVINLYRVADGRQSLVRGGIQKYAVGGATVIDWEAPFGVEISYRAEMFSDAAATQSLGFTDASTTVLEVAETWIHQPLNPSVSVAVLRLSKTATDISRETPGDLMYAEGAEVATWVGGTRRGISAVPFEVLTESLTDADKLQAVFGRSGATQSAVVCIRTPPPMRIPRTFYAAVSEVHEESVDVQNGGELIRFTFNATEARPPAPGLVAAVLRRMDIDFTYPTRDARSSAYLTRLDRDSDFSLAGVAGDA